MPFSLCASTTDSLIKFNYLNFDGEFEKNAFKKVSADKSIDLTELFLSPYKKETPVNADEIAKRIGTCVEELRPVLAEKAESKKIKIVYKKVHETFFNVYKQENSFCDIFSKGEYNCVSATALYALIFSKLNIPYQIKETPTHVYLIAYPNTAKILIETTSPENGYYQYSDEFVRKYLKSLVKSKIITKVEFDTASASRLFNAHFFSSENITLQQLAGLQFANYSSYNIEAKNYKTAIEHIKKAQFLYPCDRHKFILKEALVYEIGSNNYSRMNQVYNLAALCQFNNLDEDISDEALRNEFLRVIQAQLITNSNYQQLDSSYNIICKSLTDSSLKNNISFDYHYELARLGMLNSKDTAYEMRHLSGAYNVNQNNANLQNMILSYSVMLIKNSNDVFEILGIMKNFQTRFTFIGENPSFNAIKANCFLELTYQNYELNNSQMAENYLQQFEGLVENHKGLDLNDMYVEKAYMTGAGLYYKKGNYNKSKQLIKAGLSYAPESFRLKQMLQQF